MKIICRLPTGADAILREYAKYQLEGSTVEEVASYLLMRAVDDIVRTPGFNHLLSVAREAAVKAKLKK